MRLKKKKRFPALSLDWRYFCLSPNQGNNEILKFTTVTLSHQEGYVGHIKTGLCSACSQDFFPLLLVRLDFRNNQSIKQ